MTLQGDDMTEQEILDVLSNCAKNSRPHHRFLTTIEHYRHSNKQLYATIMKELSVCNNEQELLDKLEE